MRHTTSVIGILTVALGLLVAGCSPSSDDGGGSSSRTLRIEGPTTMVDSYNPFSPADKGPGIGYIYDPLVRVDYQHPEDPVKPWVAKSWRFEDGGKTLTFTLRDDVTFSDGSKLTSADVKFSLSVPLLHHELNPWGGTYTAVEAPDPTTVVLRFADNGFGDLQGLGTAPIVEAKQWADQDVATFVNPHPIGSGLLTLDAVHTKDATFDVRKDWWQGTSPVDHVDMVAFSQATFQLQAQQGALEWSGATWPTANTEFADQKDHIYAVVPHGGAESMVFRVDRPPLSDVHVRRAVADVLDVAALAKLNNEPVPSPCGFTASRYDNAVLIPECQDGKLRPIDVDAARSELAEGGWSVDGGDLVKDGTAAPITIAYPSDWTAAAPVYRDIKAQLKEKLGIDVNLITPPGDSYDEATESANAAMRFTGGATGLLDAFRWLGTADNFGHWTDPRTDQLVAQMAATDPADTGAMTDLGKQLQQIVYDDVPLISTSGGSWSVIINSTHWTGWPADPVSSDYVASPYVPADAEMIMLGLEPRE